MSGYSNNSPDAGRMIPAYVGTPAIDTELRSFMLRVFNTMAGGLALTGVVAYVAAASGAYAGLLEPHCSGWSCCRAARPGACRRDRGSARSRVPPVRHELECLPSYP